MSEEARSKDGDPREADSLYTREATGGDPISILGSCRVRRGAGGVDDSRRAMGD